jgi:hypothetical protein
MIVVDVGFGIVGIINMGSSRGFELLMGKILESSHACMH